MIVFIASVSKVLEALTVNWSTHWACLSSLFNFVRVHSDTTNDFLFFTFYSSCELVDKIDEWFHYLNMISAFKVIIFRCDLTSIKHEYI